MNDRATTAERTMVNQEVASRWQGAFRTYNQGAEGQTNMRGIVRIFLRSVFSPQSIPNADKFPASVEKNLVEKLRSFSPFGATKPTDAVLTEAERIMIHKIIDVIPPTVPGALETIKALSEKSNFTIWTVGDTVKSTHQLPEELVGTKDKLVGTGHQFWKLWKLGLTNKPNINIEVSDDKLGRTINNIQKQEQQGSHRFVFMDDDVKNLQNLKQIIDQENMDRELRGETPVNYDLVLVNQGRKKIVPPPEIGTKGSLGSYRIIDQFDQSPQTIDQIKKTNNNQQLGVFCDFDGVVTDNVAMRAEWDKIAQETVDDIVNKSSVRNPQKEKRGGQKLTKEDLTPANLLPFIEACKAKGLRIGVKNGAYDIIQPGHIGGFDDAKAACDILIVMLNTDKSIQKYKPIKENVPRPLVGEIDRSDVLLGLDTVDGVITYDEPDPSNLIRIIKPNVYISSKEYEGKDLPEFKAATESGTEVVFTNIREGYSTSSIVRRIITGFLDTVGAAGNGSTSAAQILKKLAGYA